MKKQKRVIPGFGLSLGVTLTFLSLIVLIPIASVIIKGTDMGFGGFLKIVFDERVLASYKVSMLSALVAALINSVFGLILAWVLVRYNFPLKRIMDGVIDLPFALPTAVAGIALTTLYSQNGLLGSFFYKFGIKIAFTPLGIIIAMTFIGIPFVVRTVQPVLEELDFQFEEAARMLGASRRTTFFKVIFPEVFPALLTGFGLAFARALGEYGSVVFISGNKPMKTEIPPFLIMSKLEQYDYSGATAIAIVMLLISFLVLFLMNVVQVRANKFSKS
ncbi:sulfate ABC transporter permease subunit CysT [Clostridium cellulovorans]|uniref:Sulfate transport system permease protein CysT n=1 Tax=Clostridium cellulovorans (strain ATCC 35296 / DSM 3052 / OCM 3 / 743B) TaxID=573061 RepID=D9SR09_CLOC7|nr:sulfate ABC transporter permease subunit CysT [Clostridium cellulovorans]ADL50297.1 sulfate ABC transporter, inner membrane subunit CysT [Clostridium cellulovorans 743B]